MLTLNNLLTLVIFVAGVIVALDCLERIHHQFSKRTTAWPIYVGVVFMAAGAVSFLHNPLLLGGLFLIGRAMQVLFGTQLRLTDRLNGRDSLG